LARRGKSFTPESRIEMDESSSCILERKLETQPSKGFAIAGRIRLKRCANSRVRSLVRCELVDSWSARRERRVRKHDDRFGTSVPSNTLFNDTNAPFYKFYPPANSSTRTL